MPGRKRCHPARVQIPEGLQWWRDEAGGAGWLARLPRLAAECAEEWELRLGAPFEPASVSLVVPATRADGVEAVLKLSFPEPESEHEADALDHWDGAGAVRLLERSVERRALLVERCVPGSRLWELSDEDEANRAAAAVLTALHRRPPPGSPYRRLVDEAERWAVALPLRFERLGRPFERRLLDRALAAIAELSVGPPDEVVVHQDLHGGNVLAAGSRWLAIDPKPLLGERAFDLASLLRDRRADLLDDPSAPRRVARRLELLVDALGVDRERARGWGIVHALAWGLDERRGADEGMVATARWLASA